MVCLECGARSTREALDQRLRGANPDLGWDGSPPAALAETLNSAKSGSRGSGSLAVSAAEPTCSSPTLCSSARTCRGPGCSPVSAPRQLGLSARARVLANGDVRTAVRAPGPEGADPGSDHQPGRDYVATRSPTSNSTPPSARYYPPSPAPPNRPGQTGKVSADAAGHQRDSERRPPRD